MTTAIVADLHLGSRFSTVRRREVRERLVAELRQADQVVLLGDLLALRDGPAVTVVEACGPFLADLARGDDAPRIVTVPGNHDHRLAGELLESLDGTLGLEHLATAGTPEAGLLLRDTGVDVAYPGFWVRDDVYATHGHYLDLHLTFPRPEVLLARTMSIVGSRSTAQPGPAAYEAALAPLYAFAYARAQGAGAPAAANASARAPNPVVREAWGQMSGARRGPIRQAAVKAAFAGAVGILNLAGFGLRADLSVGELERAGVAAMSAVARQLGVDSSHVVFGHTHRAGPMAGEAWALPGGGTLTNPGSWAFTAELVGGRGTASPFWPARYVLVEETGPPQLRQVEGLPGMTRVLLLVKGLGRGGAERLLVAIARELDRSRFEPEVAYLLADRDALVPDLARLGAPVHLLGYGRTGAWIPRLRRLVHDRGMQLVHAHSPVPAIGARLGLGVPQVYTEHSTWGAYHPATYWGNLLTYRRAAHVFAVSAAVARSARYPRPLGRLRMPPLEVLVHGHDPAALGAVHPSPREALGIPAGVPVVGTVATLRHEKGHMDLLAAADSVRREVPGVRFVLVGDGRLRGAISAEISARNLDDVVLLAGEREDAAALCPAFDVFAAPSLSEGLPLAPMEAMASAVPVVASDAGGLPEVIEDGRDGVIVPRADPESLAAAITRLLHDPDLRARLGAAGRERMEAYDIRDAVRRIEAVYDEVTT